MVTSPEYRATVLMSSHFRLWSGSLYRHWWIVYTLPAEHLRRRREFYFLQGLPLWHGDSWDRNRVHVGLRLVRHGHSVLKVWCRRDTIQSFVSFFKVFLLDTCTYPILGPLVPLFWISDDVSSGFQSQSGFSLIRMAEASIMYIPWDPPLMLHVANLLTVSIVGQQFKTVVQLYFGSFNQMNFLQIFHVILVCKPGFGKEYVIYICEECFQGYYNDGSERTGFLEKLRCVKCPEGWTTVGRGATDISDCSGV